MKPRDSTGRCSDGAKSSFTEGERTPKDNRTHKKEAGYSVLDAFMEHKTALRNFLSRYTISSHEIDDVAQEAFLRAYQAERQKKGIAQPKSFLFRVARNLVLTEISKKSRKVTDYIGDYDRDQIMVDGRDLESDVIAQQKLGIYCEAIAALPPQCRRVVLMKKVYSMSHEEIAQRMGIAVSTVEKHLVKGVRQTNAAIRQRYADIFDEPSEQTSRHNRRGRGDR